MMKLIGSAVLTLWMISAAAEDWPQWGGPGRDHVSHEKGLMQQWPEGGPKQVWLNRDAGLGYSGVAVANGRLFTMGGRNGKDYLLAIDPKSGREVWASEIGESFRESHGNGPRGTPTIANDLVFTLGGQGTLIAAKVADGPILWKTTMQDLGGKTPNWGYTESVLVDDTAVYCTPGGSEGALAALDKKTGKVLWRSKDFTPWAHYSSITPAEIQGSRQLVQLTEKEFAGIDPKDGSILWHSSFPGRTAVIPAPIVHNNRVYVTAGYGAGCKLVEIESGNKVKEVYENKVMKNHHGGVVLVDGRIYGYSDGPGWVCQDFQSGEEVWASRKLGKGAAAFAGNRLYCVEEDSGTVVLADASPQGWQEHGRFKLNPQSEQRSRSGKVWTHPVISNGRLYLRDQELLFCFDVSANLASGRGGVNVREVALGIDAPTASGLGEFRP